MTYPKSNGGFTGFQQGSEMLKRSSGAGEIEDFPNLGPRVVSTPHLALLSIGSGSGRLREIKAPMTVRGYVYKFEAKFLKE